MHWLVETSNTDYGLNGIKKSDKMSQILLPYKINRVSNISTKLSLQAFSLTFKDFLNF